MFEMKQKDTNLILGLFHKVRLQATPSIKMDGKKLKQRVTPFSLSQILENLSQEQMRGSPPKEMTILVISQLFR